LQGGAALSEAPETSLMPYIITRVNGKDAGALKRFPLTKTELNRLRGDGNCYTIISPATHRVSKFGSGCKRETPEDRWDGTGFLSKLFGKKKAKRHPMSKRIYMTPTPGGGYVSRMAGARRRKRRRR
jgi:hypothetical protein